MSEDLIRRSDAIKAMEQRYQDILRIFKRKVRDGEKAIALDMIGCIKSLPTIEPKQGEWVERTHNTLIAQVNFAYCSECGQPIMHEHTRPLWNFCPNCGARMKGADDE